MIFEITTKQEKAIVVHSNFKDALKSFRKHSDISEKDKLLIKSLSFEDAIKAYSTASERNENEEITLTILSQRRHLKYVFICSTF